MKCSPRSRGGLGVAGVLVQGLVAAGMLAAPAIAAAANVNVVKNASPISRPAPGGEFTFSIHVSSNYPGPQGNGGNLKITKIVDDVYGDLTQKASSNCSTLIGTPLQQGKPARACSFTGTFQGNPGDQQTDTVTVTAECEPAGSCQTQTGSDTATVRITGAGTQPEFEQTPESVGSQVDCKGQPATILGTGLPEVIVGTPARDFVQAGPGGDTIIGLQGNDRLCGAKDVDKVRGGDGRDFLNGGSGRDVCNGGKGRDRAHACQVTRSIP